MILCQNFLVSNKNSLEKFFAANFDHFPTEVFKLFLKSLLHYEFNHCWTFANILTPKRFKKYILSCIKTRCWTFWIFRIIWSHSGVFLERNAATYSSNNVLHSFRFDCVRTYNESSRELYRKCIKTTNFKIIDTFWVSLGQFLLQIVFISQRKLIETRSPSIA